MLQITQLLIHMLKTCSIQIGVRHHAPLQHYIGDIHNLSDSMSAYFVCPELLEQPYRCRHLYDDNFQLLARVSAQSCRQTGISFM